MHFCEKSHSWLKILSLQTGTADLQNRNVMSEYEIAFNVFNSTFYTLTIHVSETWLQKFPQVFFLRNVDIDSSYAICRMS